MAVPLVETGLVWNIQCDTYRREMERYGANTISVVEDFFCIDSEFIIHLLLQLNDDNLEQQRWKLALTLIDSFLSAFSFDLSGKKELLNTMADNYKKEFGFTHQQAKKQLDNKFRTYRKEIESAMLWENETSETINIIKTRRLAILPIARKLTAMEKSEELQVSVNALLPILIHMTMNRWFRTKNRLHEMVLYDFTSRHYTSENAKKKYNK